jgi:cold shock CspA family protein
MKSGLVSGKLVKWKDEKGFGFIQPTDGSVEVFIHISEIKNSTRRPILNDTIYYYTITKNGRVSAINAFILGARNKSVTSKGIAKQAFPSIRILKSESYDELVEKICHYFFNRVGVDPDLPQFTKEDIEHLTQFILSKEITNENQIKIDSLCNNNQRNSSNSTLKQILLILRGILSHDILYNVLNKRWKVEYGVNAKSHLMQAVPYRAKDVPSERYKLRIVFFIILKKISIFKIF